MLCISLAIITFFSHVGRFHDPRICQLYFAGPSNKMEIFVILHTFRPNLDIWVELYSLHYCMRMIYCSSHEYSHETLFITIFPATIQRSTIVGKCWHCSQYSYYSNRHYSLFVPTYISSYFLSFFPWK
jgi:hypothetical protein